MAVFSVDVSCTPEGILSCVAEVLFLFFSATNSKKKQEPNVLLPHQTIMPTNSRQFSAMDFIKELCFSVLFFQDPALLAVD